MVVSTAIIVIVVVVSLTVVGGNWGVVVDGGSLVMDSCGLVVNWGGVVHWSGVVHWCFYMSDDMSGFVVCWGTLVVKWGVVVDGSGVMAHSLVVNWGLVHIHQIVAISVGTLVMGHFMMGVGSVVVSVVWLISELVMIFVLVVGLV